MVGSKCGDLRLRKYIHTPIHTEYAYTYIQHIYIEIYIDGRINSLRSKRRRRRRRISGRVGRISLLRCTDSSDDADVSSINSITYHKLSPATSFRRRQSLSERARDSAGSTNPSSSISSGNHPKLIVSELIFSSKINENENASVITNGNNLRDDDLVGNVSNLNENKDSNSNILLYLVGLLKAVGYQTILLINYITFPMRLIYTSYMFVMDPFGLKNRAKRFVIRRLMRIGGLVCASILKFVREWFKEHKSIWKLGLKCGWGLLWCVYVCVVLVGLLAVAFGMGGMVIRGVVEEPMRVKQTLNFDYAEKSPVAYVPLLVCPGVDCGVDCMKNVEVRKIGGGRMVPLNHKLQVTVSLELPESDYNRNLGIFQVRVDFLDVDGRLLASSMCPCMLQFKSEIIRLLLTILRVAPLITGYISESQHLNINFRGFTEGSTPTACLRVTIEQQAEFQPSAGIPEIYAASLSLESELPLLQQVLWYWKKTLYILISMTMFIIELLFTLLCCKPLLIPRVKLRENTVSSNTGRDNHPVQR